MVSTDLELLEKKIQEDIENTRAQMGAGRCENFAYYREAVGIIRGLEYTLDHIRALAKRGDDDD